MHTLLNLVLASELPVIMEQMPPLDYFSSITFGQCACRMPAAADVLTRAAQRCLRRRLRDRKSVV